MSEITPLYCPPASCFKPSAPEDAFTTEYPFRSSAAFRNAITDGSSSINKIGAVWLTAACKVTVQPLSQPWQAAPRRAESGQQTCSRRYPCCSSTESRRRAPAQFRSKYSVQALYPFPAVSSCRTGQKYAGGRRSPCRYQSPRLVRYCQPVPFESQYARAAPFPSP